jgi:hypothetical protein
VRYVLQCEFELDDEAVMPDVLMIVETVLPYMADNVFCTSWQVPMTQPEDEEGVTDDG